MSEILPPRHHITQIRRETRRRRLTVTQVERLTPGMQRISFASPELHDFASDAPDDHVKLFFEGSGKPGGGPCMRDYTPRRFDTAAGTLVIDFALHDVAGPATAWALAARPGDTLEIGGPRGSRVVADDFDWYLLIGDETALPAIGRRVETLRPGVPVTTAVVIGSDAERQTFLTSAAWSPIWVTRDRRSSADSARLLQALSGHALPPGDGYVWIAAEAQTARALRATMIETHSHPKSWIKAAGYWVHGEGGAHVSIEE